MKTNGRKTLINPKKIQRVRKKMPIENLKVVPSG